MPIHSHWPYPMNICLNLSNCHIPLYSCYPVQRPMQQWVLAWVNPSSSRWTDIQLHKPYLFILTRPQRDVSKDRQWDIHTTTDFGIVIGYVYPFQRACHFCINVPITIIPSTYVKNVTCHLSTTKRLINIIISNI